MTDEYGARGYYDMDRERWITADEAAQEYQDEQEAIDVQRAIDAERQLALERRARAEAPRRSTHAAGIHAALDELFGAGNYERIDQPVRSYERH